MSETLRLFTSVVALSGLAVDALSVIRLAEDIRQAPSDIQSLNEQVDHFRQLIIATSETIADADDNVTQDVMRKAERLLKDITRILDAKFPQPQQRWTLTRNAAWVLKHKAKLSSMGAELRDVQMGLILALSLKSITLAKIPRHLIKLPHDPNEGVLVQGPPSYARGPSNEVASADIIKFCSPKLQSTSIQPMNLCQDSSVTTPGSQSVGTIQRQRVTDVDRNVGRGSKKDSHTPGSPLSKGGTQHTLQASDDEKRGPIKPSYPTTPLEASPTFWPEAYTTEHASPQLFAYQTIPQAPSDFTRTVLYGMFCRLETRKWVRITLSLTIGIESALWKFEKLPQDLKIKREPPAPAVKALRQILNSRNGVESDINLKIYLGSHGSQQIPEPLQRTQDDATEDSFSLARYLRSATSILYHAGCRRVPESALEQVSLPRRMKPFNFNFISRLESLWLLDFRFGFDQTMNNNLMYQLRALHSMRGKYGICDLVGLVMDEDSTLVKGYLVKAPTVGYLHCHMRRANSAGVPIPWSRRERYCQAIVQAVAEAHSAGFTVGNLGPIIDTGVLINEDHRVSLFRFQPFYYFEACHKSLIPPEHHALVAGKREGTIDATPESDIFLLGITIWMIAANKNSSMTNEATEAEFHKAIAGEIQSFEHLNDDIPIYVHSLIKACINRDPYQRPAAWELLDMFPKHTAYESAVTASSPSGGPNETLEGNLHRLSHFLGLYGNLISCDICGDFTPDLSYACNICSMGDFDLCPECLSKGHHCRDDDHYLCEKKRGVFGSYFSNVKENGQREVVIF